MYVPTHFTMHIIYNDNERACENILYAQLTSAGKKSDSFRRTRRTFSTIYRHYIITLHTYLHTVYTGPIGEIRNPSVGSTAVVSIAILISAQLPT